MKKRSIHSFIRLVTLLLTITAVSCQKLTEHPDSISTPENFYTSPAQCEAAYAASMHALWSTWSGYQNPLGFPDGHYAGNNAILNFGSTSYNDLWTWHYKAISNINAALKAIKGGSLEGNSDQVIADVIAQGRFLRAFNYFTLVRLYGKIPYITEDTPDPVSVPLTPDSRMEIADVYDQIEADLTYATENMNDYNSSTPAKPNKWIAKGLLAKVYLTRAGLFNDVDVVIHWHPDNNNAITMTKALANSSAKFRFHGISAHAAGAPERGRSALDAVEAMDYMVNMMREHVPSDTRIHYVITNGGKAPIVVPDFAEVY